MGGHKKLAFAIALHRIGASCAVFGSVARNSAALQDTSRARRLRGADAVLLLMMSKGPIIIALRNPRDSSNVGEGASRRETPDEGPKTTSAHEDLAQSQNIVVHTGRISNNPNLVISAIGAGRVEHVHTSIDLTAFPRLKLAEHMSPFRYPGGKAFLAGYLADAISALPVSKEATYVEPFCGGAGAALALLGQGKVKQIHLNDKDIRIYSAWKAILNENERFLKALRDTPVNLDTWMKCRSVLNDCNVCSLEIKDVLN